MKMLIRQLDISAKRGLVHNFSNVESCIVSSSSSSINLNTLAVAVGEDPSTLEDVYEPYLIMLGFLKRTPRGREATSLAYKHMEKTK